MRTKLFVAALIAGMATTLVSVPAANAADSRLRCVTHKITIKGSDKILKVHNGCAGRVKANVHQTGSDSGYKEIARGGTRTWVGGKWHYVCGLKIYYKGTRYYNKVSGNLGDC
ncbi:hypothetical protein AB0B45_51115 [Nonomuraea sp. NPDC049152]|uniref:hypothetical protein n=1 Tax=Nonomuraea sp. NPDC049152 TaxID=3154350 RepID=UPI0033E669F4